MSKEVYNFKKHRDSMIGTPSDLDKSFETWKADPSETNHGTIMQGLGDTINKGLYSFAGNDPTLKARAHVLASQAIKSYDPKKGANLKTHVYNNLQRLNRLKSERSRVVHIPENVKLDASNVVRFTQQYREDNGYDPSLHTIQDSMGMNRKRIQKALNMRQQSETDTLDEKGQPTTMPLQRTANDIWMDYVYHDLSEIDRKIFEWTTGYYGHDIMKKGDIARKLNVSGPAISKRVSKIVKKIEEGAQYG